MYDDDDLLPISALQHLLFCERQCALIHLDRLWAEDRRTIEGRLLHRRAHGDAKGPRGGGLVAHREGVRIVRSLPLRCLRLGVAGVADVVEFAEGEPPLPVEYKRGRPKKGDFDRVQVCAQALCLEEMLNTSIPRAALYYGQIRRRDIVLIDAKLRVKTEAAAERLRLLLAAERTPPAEFAPKCKRCSLLNLCLPTVTSGHRSASRYLRAAVARALESPRELPGDPE